MYILPHKLKRLRKAARLTQKDLAENCGMEQSHISRIERGETGASIDLIRCLAQQLDTTVAELVGDDFSEGNEATAATQARAAVLQDPDVSPGLRDLAADTALTQALAITPDEWRILSAIPLRHSVRRDGYVQLLITIRAIST
jgi:transcriptional regulator with XRE-family HTH domain